MKNEQTRRPAHTIRFIAYVFLKEIPRVQRFADRPALEDILHDTEDRTQRDAAIFKACQEYGYTKTQIAVATGLHYSTVSKIIKKIG